MRACVCLKMINEQKRDAVCLRVVLRAAWRGEGDCGKVRCNVYSELSSWSVIISCHCILDKHSMRICVCDLGRQKTESRLYICTLVYECWLNRRRQGKDLCQSVCGIWSEGDRWCLSQLRRSRTVYPGGIARRVCFDEEEHQKEITLPLVRRPHMAQPNLSLFLFLYPDCSSPTWSTINTSPTFLANTLLRFHWDKHTYFDACSCSPRLTHIHTFRYVCEVASCAWRECWQMWR